MCVCVHVCLPKALLPYGNGWDAVTTGKARRVGPDTEPQARPLSPPVKGTYLDTNTSMNTHTCFALLHDSSLKCNTITNRASSYQGLSLALPASLLQTLLGHEKTRIFAGFGFGFGFGGKAGCQGVMESVKFHRQDLRPI